MAFQICFRVSIMLRLCLALSISPGLHIPMISSWSGIIWTTTLSAHSMEQMRPCLYSWPGDAGHRWANIFSDVDLKTSACRMWTDFVKFGNPSPPGVEWTPVSEDFRGWLEIGATGQLQMTSSDSTFQARMEFWDSLFPLATMPWLSFIQNRQVTLHSLRYIWPKGRDNQSWKEGRT